MTIDTLINKITSFRKKSEMEAWVKSYSGPAIKGEISSTYVKLLGEHLKENRRHDASALALALAMIDANGLIASLRRSGLLRASRYEFKAGSPREITELLLRLNETLRLSQERAEYLESVIALYTLSAGAKQMRDGIVTRLRSQRGTALKTFLVFANQKFAHGWKCDLFAPSSCLEHYSVEKISDAISRLIDIHRQALGMKASDWFYVAPQALNPFNSSFEKDLLDALHLNELIKAETLIDGLPYKAVIDCTGISISSIDPDIEKSVRLGYVQMEMQIYVRHVGQELLWAQGEKPTSLEQVFKIYFESGLKKLIHLNPKPIPRLTLSLPMTAEFFKPLAGEHYFREDLQSLMQLGVNNFKDTSLAPFEVAPGVSSIDLFKINRLFAFIAYLMLSALRELEDKTQQEALTLQSVIPSMPLANFISLLQCVLSPEKAESVLSLLTLDEKREFVDLQYTPFIRVEDNIIVSPALVAQSNLVRNIVCANNLLKDRIGDYDPMQHGVANALRQSGFLVEEEVSVSIHGADRDTDIVAYRDRVLYLFECKNAYHPCNVHEMRNSFDHIKKASEQLTLRKQWFTQSQHQAHLLLKLGWKVPAPEVIRTGILIANRVFTGAMVNGHPVRQAHEFINFILRGEVNSPGGTYAVWDGEHIVANDLDKYLGCDGLVADQFAALKSIRKEYRIHAKTLAFDSWFLDAQLLNASLALRYRTKFVQSDDESD